MTALEYVKLGDEVEELEKKLVDFPKGENRTAEQEKEYHRIHREWKIKYDAFERGYFL